MLHHEEVTSKVQLLDIVPGEPASILIANSATRPDGKQRTITQKVCVLDSTLFSRLCATASKGDEIEVIVVTEWSKQGYSTYLSSFSLTPASDSTPAIAGKAS